MRAAIAAGASMVNDVSALGAPGALEAVAAIGRGRVPDAHAGRAADDAAAPALRGRACARCAVSCASARAAAWPPASARERIVVDPGFGFGKALEHNLALLRGLPQIAADGLPVLAGLSRKRMIAADHRPDDGDRLAGSLALADACGAEWSAYRARTRRRSDGGGAADRRCGRFRRGSSG